MHRVGAVWETDGCSYYCSDGDEQLLGWLNSRAQLKPPDVREEVDGGGGTKPKSENGEVTNEQSFTASRNTRTGGTR